jgi:hypothetical protein
MREDGEKRRLQQAEGLSEGRSRMCDYSLHSVKSRPAKVGDKLTTRDYRHARLFGVGGRERSCLRSTGNGVVLC